jgi:hypothetical protein
MIIPAEKSADRIRLIAIETMKGAFGNEGALRFYGIARYRRALLADNQFQATEGLSFDFLFSSGRTFSTNASAVMPCFLRRIGTAPCSTN